MLAFLYICERSLTKIPIPYFQQLERFLEDDVIMEALASKLANLSLADFWTLMIIATNDTQGQV